MSIKTKTPTDLMAKRGLAKSSQRRQRREVSSPRAPGPNRARPMTAFAAARHGSNVADTRGRLGLTQEELGRVIGYSTRSVASWESGRQPVSGPARLKLIEVDRLAAALAQIVPPRDLGDWLRTPNPAFDDQPPIQLLERGEADRLWHMIHQIDANVAN